MNYTVRWLPTAEAKVRWLWARALVKEDVAELADAINRLLRDRPFDLGESRERADIRLWFHRPRPSHSESTTGRRWCTSRR